MQNEKNKAVIKKPNTDYTFIMNLLLNVPINEIIDLFENELGVNTLDLDNIQTKEFDIINKAYLDLTETLKLIRKSFDSPYIYYSFYGGQENEDFGKEYNCIYDLIDYSKNCSKKYLNIGLNLIIDFDE